MEKIVTKIKALIALVFPRFFCMVLIKKLTKNKDDLEIILSFLQNSHNVLKDKEFREKMGLGKTDYSQHLFSNKISPVINRVCLLIKENDFSGLKICLSKQSRENLIFFNLVLFFCFDTYKQLLFYRKMYQKSENIVMRYKEELRRKEWATYLEQERNTILNHINMMKDCNLNELYF